MVILQTAITNTFTVKVKRRPRLVIAIS